jgi:hypothetical protein
MLRETPDPGTFDPPEVFKERSGETNILPLNLERGSILAHPCWEDQKLFPLQTTSPGRGYAQTPALPGPQGSPRPGLPPDHTGVFHLPQRSPGPDWARTSDPALIKRML